MQQNNPLTNLISSKLDYFKKRCLSLAKKYNLFDDDILSILLEKLWTNRTKYDPSTGEQGFERWAETILRTTSIDLYRRYGKRSTLFTDIDYLTESRSTHNTAISNIGINEIISNLNQLPPKRKQVMILMIQGYKNEDIAKELTMPLGSVKTNIHHARKTLSKWYEL